MNKAQLYFRSFLRQLRGLSPRRKLVIVHIALWLLVVATTSLVFLHRAGSLSANNIPISWDLTNSDNGILYQFSKDVYTHQKLDWAFSGQTFVFPEIPISLLAYGLAGGSVYFYFPIVALINISILYAIIAALLQTLFRKDGLKNRILKLSLAMLPLLALPLLADNTLFQYHLGATYYFGAYVAIFLFPLLVTSKKRASRLAIGLAIALCCASNPMGLVFTIPAAIAVSILAYIRSDDKTAKKYVLRAVVVTMGSLILQRAFKKLSGASTSHYMSLELFAKRLGGIKLLLANMWGARYERYLLIASLFIFSAVSLLAFRHARRLSSAREKSESDAIMYLALVPAVSMVSLYLCGLINMLYLWPAFVFPWVVFALHIPKQHLTRLAGISYGGFIILLLLPQSLRHYKHSSRYFSYKSNITQCLDSSLPPGVRVGYSTFSDARSNELTSSRDITLIPILEKGNPNTWLANKAYYSTKSGSFFVINHKGAEPEINASILTSMYGEPQKYFSCTADVDVMLYTDESSISKIHNYYTGN